MAYKRHDERQGDALVKKAEQDFAALGHRAQH